MRTVRLELSAIEQHIPHVSPKMQTLMNFIFAEILWRGRESKRRDFAARAL